MTTRYSNPETSSAKDGGTGADGVTDAPEEPASIGLWTWPFKKWGEFYLSARIPEEGTLLKLNLMPRRTLLEEGNSDGC